MPRSGSSGLVAVHYGNDHQHPIAVGTPWWVPWPARMPTRSPPGSLDRMNDLRTGTRSWIGSVGRVMRQPVLRRVLPGMLVSAPGHGMSMVAGAWLAVPLPPPRPARRRTRPGGAADAPPPPAAAALALPA